jgi:mRNA-degrading endonuclease RelE of RelBE toxin-antitoxin system
VAYFIDITGLASSELKAIRAYDQRRITNEIERQLRHQPGVETRNRKNLGELIADFEHRSPIWELRVAHYRVFYDIDEESLTVTVRAIRRKEHGETTEEVIRDH